MHTTSLTRPPIRLTVGKPMWLPKAAQGREIRRHRRPAYTAVVSWCAAFGRCGPV